MTNSTNLLQTKKYIILGLLLALIIRLGFVYFKVGFNSTSYLFSDEKKYHRIAVYILDNGQLPQTAYIPPGYPLFISALYYVFGTNPRIVRIFQSILGTLTCLILFLFDLSIFFEIFKKKNRLNNYNILSFINSNHNCNL